MDGYKKTKFLGFFLVRKKEENHSCVCQRSFQIGRRADDERLLPCNDVGADIGRERILLLFIPCEAEEGRLWLVDFFSVVENVEFIEAALNGRLG
jgi:hypothetical protein